MRVRGVTGRRGLAALALLGLLQAVASAAPEVYDIDRAHSSAGFKVRHYFTQVPGRFGDLSGTVHWDEAAPTQSKVELVIQAASISTNNEKRDAHLKSADFFDAEKFPTLTFRSTKIEPTERANFFKVHGELTMKGVTKPIVVDLEVLGFGDTPMGKRGGFSATAKINRLDFGVSWNNGTVLGEEVSVDFPIEVAKKKAM